MAESLHMQPPESDLSFKVFFELMRLKVTEILLVSSPYDAFIMDEDGRLAERIIQEYQGLNLSRPPRVTWVSTITDALAALDRGHFDIVITMPRVDDMDAFDFGQKVKAKMPDLPVYLLTPNTSSVLIDQLNRKYTDRSAIDRIYVWTGNTDLLLALIKNYEDRINVEADTAMARVRVVIMVEDSPYYRSTVLPILYKEIVMQTQRLINDSLNEEHRILRMRARPKILVAENYEEAMALYQQYKPYLLAVFSDVRYPRQGRIDPEAGFELLSHIRSESPDLPLLMFSTEENNRSRAMMLPAVFLNKNSTTLHGDISDFFLTYLGFGEFVFRLPDGTEVGRASNLRTMEKVLPDIPDSSVFYHALRNDFSTWMMARCEIRLASTVRSARATDFSSAQEIKQYLISQIQERRQRRQKGVVSDFTTANYDPDTNFIKVGMGSLGGKARGLAFMANLLKQATDLQETFKGTHVVVPRTIVIGTEGFDSFISENQLSRIAEKHLPDMEIRQRFLDAKFPAWVRRDLEFLLADVTYPLAVRSSSLLEDAQYRPCAGLYQTVMVPNNHPDLQVRLSRLLQAIKLVYASTYQQAARDFLRHSLYRLEDEKMAVIIQRLTGRVNGNYFYPALSGVAQSYNFYPISHMKAEEGIAHLALGLGKTVVEGGTALRFSPHYPQLLPQFTKTEDILANSQRQFFALKLDDFPKQLGLKAENTLAKLELDDVWDHPPVQYLSSTYNAQDHRIRDVFQPQGHPVLTFARVLKFGAFPLCDILIRLLEMGHKGMACPVEIEFAVNLGIKETEQAEFSLLQIRPMAFCQHDFGVEIDALEIAHARLYSNQAMGGSTGEAVTDIVLVDPDEFDPSQTLQIAQEIGSVNQKIAREGRRYLLIGPGRWGSADRWLGIPVIWNDISAAATIVEASVDKLQADPSQGSHFFHNITSLGVGYLTVAPRDGSRIDWQWLKSLPVIEKTRYLRHIRPNIALTLKIDGRKSQAVLLDGLETGTPFE
jgi:DNA-binding NarL/FixJ family response regulator